MHPATIRLTESNRFIAYCLPIQTAVDRMSKSIGRILPYLAHV